MRMYTLNGLGSRPRTVSRSFPGPECLHAHRLRSPRIRALQSTTQRGSWAITLSRHHHASCTYHSHKPITYFGFVLTVSYMQQKATMLSIQWVQSKNILNEKYWWANSYMREVYSACPNSWFRWFQSTLPGHPHRKHSSGQVQTDHVCAWRVPGCIYVPHRTRRCQQFLR